MKVLVAHADLSARGGAEAYAEALIARLRHLGHSVSVLDIAGLRRGNALLRQPLFVLGRLPVLRRLSLWKYALVCRRVPALASAHDAIVYTYGEGPEAGRPSLRILHAPSLFSAHPKLLRLLGAATPFWPRQLYAWLCRQVARPVSASATTTSLANSRWTARIAARTHRIKEPALLCPKIVSKAAESRDRGRYRMIAVGRIVPNKRLEEAITLTQALNARGLPARLTIVGRADTPYARALIQTCNALPYVTVLPDASDAVLRDALAAARIGVHCFRHEHFGIAIGEMITAGLLPLVHDGGGARALVPDPAHRFRTQQDAVAKAAALMLLPDEEAHSRSTRFQQTDALQQALDFDARADAALQAFLEAI